MKVGPIEFTLMPCGARSIAIALVRPSMPCLVVQYTVRRAPPTWPICEEMWMIEPLRPASTMPPRHRLRNEERGAQIERGDGVVVVLRHLQKMARAVGAGVVHQDVERRLRGDRRAHRRQVGHVQHQRLGAAAFGADSRRRRPRSPPRCARRARHARRPAPARRRAPGRCRARRRSPARAVRPAGTMACAAGSCAGSARTDRRGSPFPAGRSSNSCRARRATASA